MQSRKSLLFVLLILANVIWSGSFAATTIATRELSPSFLTMIRLLVGGLLLSPFIWTVSRKVPEALNTRSVIKIALMGIIGFTFPVTLESSGIHVSSPALGAVSIALEPLFTVLIASILLRQSLARRRQLAMLIAAVGAWFVGGCPRPGVVGYALGDILLLFAVICYATYNAFSSRMTENVPASAATSIMLLAGGIGCVPIWLLTGGLMPHHVTVAPLFATLFLSVLATAGAYLIWLVVLQDRDVASATITLYLQPIFGVVISIWLVHITPAWYFYVGAALILFALYTGRQQQNKETTTSAPIAGDSVEIDASH